MKTKYVAATVLSLVAAVAASGPKFYSDDPLIAEPPPIDASMAAPRKLSDYYDALHHMLAEPGEHQTRHHVTRAQGISTLGDPMEGAWWMRRHYFKRMSADELRKGPSGNNPPATDAPWTLVSAKTEGVTAGFVIEDSRGVRYFMKFDPKLYPELATGADQISSKVFHALGYHVPDNYIVTFKREQIKIKDGVKIMDAGRPRDLNDADLDEILRKVAKDDDDRYRGTASLAVEGKPLGPYRYYGTRADDPNDIVPHEHRRDLRGMRYAAAWVGHYDSRAINTMDALVDEGGVKVVRHLQLDFGATLGSASNRAKSARSGGEYLFGWKQSALELGTLGAAVPKWATAHYPGIRSVGNFESKTFEAEKWMAEYPNPAFDNALPDDEFWMAKQIAAFTRDDVAAVVSAAQYSDPKASEYMTQCLWERREKILRAAFARVLPLDRIRVEGETLRWDDLAAMNKMGDAGPVNVEWFSFNNTTQARSGLHKTGAELPTAAAGEYLLAVLTQTKQPSHKIEVYFRGTSAAPQLVGIEYQW